MIRHIVFFSLKDRAELDLAIERLRALAQIPGSTHFEVQRNAKADLYGNDVDLVVYAEFPDIEALHAYKRHQTYAETTRIVRPMRELRFAADIEAS